MVAPVTDQADENGYASVTAWLPEGVWTDIFTGDRYEIGRGGKVKTLIRTLDSIPVLARSGAVLPLSADKGNGCGNPVSLEVWLYSGNGSYVLYEDGEKEGNAGFTQFNMTHQCGVQTVTVCATGDLSVIPSNREITLLFKDIPEGNITLFHNGKAEQTGELYENCVAVQFTFAAGDRYEIKVEYCEKTCLERLKDRARRILTFAESGNEEKENVYNRLKASNSEEEFCDIVRGTAFTDAVKDRLTETVTHC